ncbi:MAG: hypothetical protein HC854_04500 [Flavobacterium sp.]|nr:hypothetical protein [Flavobacterium sp.]
MSKINLEEKKQIQIGQKLVKQDSLATILLSKGESTEILKNYYTIDANFLAGILSTEELEHFMYENDNTNRFLLALTLSDTLRLKAEQISQIRKENSFLNTQINISSENKYKLYIDKLSTILDSKQYVILIKTIYVDKSVEETNKDWDNIKKVKLAENKDSITVYKELYKYNLYKNSFLDSYANKYDLKKAMN